MWATGRVRCCLRCVDHEQVSGGWAVFRYGWSKVTEVVELRKGEVCECTSLLLAVKRSGEAWSS